MAFDAKSRKQSRVQYGETRYDKVNSVPHLWCRAKEKYRRRAVELLRDFVRERATRTAPPQTSVVALPPPSPAPPPPPSRPPPSPWSCVIADFFGEDEYGAEYLTLAVGDGVEGHAAPIAAEGWGFGRIVYADGGRSKLGWYPPALVR